MQSVAVKLIPFSIYRMKRRGGRPFRLSPIGARAKLVSKGILLVEISNLVKAFSF